MTKPKTTADKFETFLAQSAGQFALNETIDVSNFDWESLFTSSEFSEQDILNDEANIVLAQLSTDSNDENVDPGQNDVDKNGNGTFNPAYALGSEGLNATQGATGTGVEDNQFAIFGDLSLEGTELKENEDFELPKTTTSETDQIDNDGDEAGSDSGLIARTDNISTDLSSFQQNTVDNFDPLIFNDNDDGGEDITLNVNPLANLLTNDDPAEGIFQTFQDDPILTGNSFNEFFTTPTTIIEFSVYLEMDLNGNGMIDNAIVNGVVTQAEGYEFFFSLAQNGDLWGQGINSISNPLRGEGIGQQNPLNMDDLVVGSDLFILQQNLQNLAGFQFGDNLFADAPGNFFTYENQNGTARSDDENGADFTTVNLSMTFTELNFEDEGQVVLA